ncbi:MAG TPA: 30S ribosomal protein S4 [Methanophagales archaeon]|nr:30S ribosomal protein S4 [Methanophagales archaeon]
MGHPKRRKKTYERPRRPWVMQRIKEEKELAEKYGLKNKREIWKAASFIKGYRREARNILAEVAGRKPAEHTMKKSEAILTSLKRKGILKEGVGEVENEVESVGSRLEDVLALSIENILERRLQTRVYKKGLSNSLKHARQLIVHGHIAVNNRRVTVPSYIVSVDEERGIDYYEHAPVSISTISGEKGEEIEEGKEK